MITMSPYGNNSGILIGVDDGWVTSRIFHSSSITPKGLQAIY